LLELKNPKNHTHKKTKKRTRIGKRNTKHERVEMRKIVEITSKRGTSKKRMRTNSGNRAAPYQKHPPERMENGGFEREPYYAHELVAHASSSTFDDRRFNYAIFGLGRRWPGVQVGTPK